MKHYAFYGTLRRNMDFFEEFRANIDYIKTVKVDGFAMYSLGEYPYVVRAEDHSVICDLCTIHDRQAALKIESIEAAYGYEMESIKVDGNNFYIFVFRNYIPGTPAVESGDWLKFCTKTDF